MSKRTDLTLFRRCCNAGVAVASSVISEGNNGADNKDDVVEGGWIFMIDDEVNESQSQTIIDRLWIHII